MNENVLAVLMYIFDNHIRAKREMPANEEALFDELEGVGFDTETIHRALDWLATLFELRMTEEDDALPQMDSFRVYSEEECFILNNGVRGCLTFLEQAGILNAITRERVINRLLASEFEEIDVEYVRMITVLVLLSDENDTALTAMEQLLHTEYGTGRH